MKASYRVNIRTAPALAILLLLVLTACSERRQTNPFDPGFNEAVLSVSLAPDDDRVTLSWRLIQNLEGITGFRVYKGSDSLATLAPWRDLPVGQRSLTDSLLQPGRWYYYRVSVLGPDVETPLSELEAVYIGPGDLLLLAQDDFTLWNLAYDLINPISQVETAYRPGAWTVEPGARHVWLAYGAFINAVGRVDRLSGQETLFSKPDLGSPVGMAWLDGQVFVLDNGTDRILRFEGDAFLEDISLPSGQYRAMMPEAGGNRLAVLEDGHLYRVDPGTSPPAVTAIDLDPGFIGVALDTAARGTYILRLNSGESTSRITTVRDGQVEGLPVDLSFAAYRFAHAAHRDGFFVNEYLGPGR